MKILWISDAISLTTGFGSQSLLVTKNLQKLGYEIITLGWGSDTECIHEGLPVFPLYSNFSNTSLILKHYYDFNPDVIVSYADLHAIQAIISDVRDIRFKDRWIHWLPVDGDPYPEQQDAFYQEIRHLVTASHFGEKIFKNHYKGNLKTIYNAVSEDYKPQESVFSKELENKFVCLFVGMNQARKNIPFLLEGFSKFAKNKSSVLVMHTQPTSAKPTFHGWDIPYLIKTLKLEKEILISSDIVSNTKLNKLYNSAHLLISASGGEGFNLPAAEAMMTGMPLLLPNFTTGPEFVGINEDRCGELINISEYIYESPLNIRKAIINTDDMAKKLDYFYNDWQTGGIILKDMGSIAHDRAKALFSVDKITQQWNQLIEDVVKRNTIRQFNLNKTIRDKKKIVFIDDLSLEDWTGGTQLSTKKIVDAAKENGIEAVCVTLETCKLEELYSADLIVLNNIRETIKKSNLISEIVSHLPYVKWEHDLSFCEKENNICASDCEFREEIYANAKSIIFQSPLHLEKFSKHFSVKKHLILTPPIDPELFLKAKLNRENKILWTGLMNPFRGIEEAIRYAEEHPNKKFLFHSAYPPLYQSYADAIKALPNCELRIQKLTYEKMADLFGECSDLLYQPKGIDASSRICLEAWLAGCRIRPNNNVGLFSYNWDWTDRQSIIEKIKNAPKDFYDHIKEQFSTEESTISSKINIVFFPSGDEHLPSSHIRIYTMSEILKNLGYNVQIVDTNLPDEIKTNIISSLASSDIVYIQKTYNKFNRAINFKSVKERNPIIYDVDDYYPERNMKNEIHYMYNSDEMARLADIVIVGSHKLAQWNSKNNKNIKIIPSLVDETLYQHKNREEKEPHQIKILWTEKDGRIYLEDLLLIKDVLDSIHKKYGCQLILQSFLPDEINDIQNIFPYANVLPLENFQNYVHNRIPMMGDCDFFIAPFSPTAERYLEKQHKAGQNSRHMMAMGLPGIASPTGEHDHFIEDNVNGFLAKTKQEWHDKIEKLITDNALRIQFGVKSRETIEKNYTTDKTTRKLLEAIHSIKHKYSHNITIDQQYRALVTIKWGSTGGGTVTSKHIKNILENNGYKTQLLHCDKVKNINHIFQIDEQKLKQPIPLRDYTKKYPVDAIYFDDIARYERESAKAEKIFLVLCGCANVHEEYYTNPVLLTGAPGINRVFIKNYALHKYLNSLFGDKFVYWQGGIDGQHMRNRYGKAIYKHPKDGILLTSSFSQGWWKNPTMASLAAFAIWKKYPKTKYFKPILREEDLEFNKYSNFKISGNTLTIPQEQLLETLVTGQLGLEICLADAFPRTLLDYFSLGIPLITSSALDFLSKFPVLYENLVVHNPNDPFAIYQKALNLLEDQEKWETISAMCVEFTRVYSLQAEHDVLVKYSNLPGGKLQLDSDDIFLNL